MVQRSNVIKHDLCGMPFYWGADTVPQAQYALLTVCSNMHRIKHTYVCRHCLGALAYPWGSAAAWYWCACDARGRRSRGTCAPHAPRPCC